MKLSFKNMLPGLITTLLAVCAIPAYADVAYVPGEIFFSSLRDYLIDIIVICTIIIILIIAVVKIKTGRVFPSKRARNIILGILIGIFAMIAIAVIGTLFYWFL